MNVKNQDAYDTNMASIRETFGDSKLIPLIRVADYLGVDARTLAKTKGFPLKEIGDSKRKSRFVVATGLAAWMC